MTYILQNFLCIFLDRRDPESCLQDHLIVPAVERRYLFLSRLACFPSVSHFRPHYKDDLASQNWTFIFDASDLRGSRSIRADLAQSAQISRNPRRSRSIRADLA